MRFPHILMAAACAIAVSIQSVHAQIPGKDASSLNASMIRLFGGNTNFIAKTEARVLNKSNVETTFLPMGFEMFAGSIRVEVNLTSIKSKELSPEIVSQMKQLGMDQLTTVQLADKKVNLQIYPSLKSYVELPMVKEEIDALAANYKVEKTSLGKETIDGHSCDKCDVTLTDDKSVKQKAIVWYAKDMKDFPIQIQTTADDSTLVLRFKEVKLGRPEASHFTSPAGLKKYETMEALMTDAAMKRIGNFVPTK